MLSKVQSSSSLNFVSRNLYLLRNCIVCNAAWKAVLLFYGQCSAFRFRADSFSYTKLICLLKWIYAHGALLTKTSSVTKERSNLPIKLSQRFPTSVLFCYLSCFNSRWQTFSQWMLIDSAPWRNCFSCFFSRSAQCLALYCWMKMRGNWHKLYHYLVVPNIYAENCRSGFSRHSWKPTLAMPSTLFFFLFVFPFSLLHIKCDCGLFHCWWR